MMVWCFIIVLVVSILICIISYQTIVVLLSYAIVLSKTLIADPAERVMRCGHEDFSEIPSFQIVKGLRGYSYDIRMQDRSFTVNLQWGRINTIHTKPANDGVDPVGSIEDETVIQTIIDLFFRYRLTSLKHEEEGDYLSFSPMYSFMYIKEQYSAIIPSGVVAPDVLDGYQLLSDGVFIRY